MSVCGGLIRERVYELAGLFGARMGPEAGPKGVAFWPNKALHWTAATFSVLRGALSLSGRGQ